MEEEKYINYEGLSRFYYLMSLILANKYNKQDVYSKTQINNIIGDLGNAQEEIEGVHYTQEEINSAQEGDDAYGKTTNDWKIEPQEAIPHTVKSLIDTKANKTEIYTKEEIQDIINLLDLSKVNTEDLAQIAFSGSYTDLINTPTIPPAMTILSYGSSTWQDFINAYNSNTIVYCRASSNSNPATGNQSRMAFMAYLGGSPTNPTEVEFQYYRSVSSKSSSQQGDQVFIYKLTSAGQWSVTTREASSKILVGTGITCDYNNGNITLSIDSSIIPNKSELSLKANVDDISVEIRSGHDYVEIGGVKWATMNVGANSITDTGLYFQWGDTQGYTADQVGSGEGQKYFGWVDYKYGNGTSSPGTTGMTKYNSTDGKIVLEASDDVVITNWGGQWRMPTTEEYVALGNAVNTAWTDDYKGSGVAGLVCTDKTDSNKTLFFPACGKCGNGSVGDVGYSGYYWSSSLSYRLNFNSNNALWSYDDGRFFGFPIRGVYIGDKSSGSEKVLGTTILNSERDVWNNSIANLQNQRTLTVNNITTNTSSLCSITGIENSGRGELIIYKNNSDQNLIVTVPTTYFTPSGQPIELICRIGGYCEVNYINVDGNIYTRGV